MRGMPINNPQIRQFYEGNGTYGAATRSNMGRIRRPGMGSIQASSSSTGAAQTQIPNAGGNVANANGLQTTAQSIASLTNSATSLAKGVLQAEAAQNAINAQRNLTSALTPGMITLILLGIGYFVLVKK